VKHYLNGFMYKNNVLFYLLWRYENNLQNKGYSVQHFTIDNQQVEHISPIAPTNGEAIETGYDVNSDNEYSEEFISNYLNCIGNLMLISGSHNASIGNKPFAHKLSSYNQNPLLNQQAEIKNFSKKENQKDVWKKASIDERQKKIVDFAIQEWSFN